MSIQRQENLSELKLWFIQLQSLFSANRHLRHQDSNIEIEGFFRDVLNVANRWELKNINSLFKRSQDAFDLADRENGVAVQVTTTTTAQKIRDTLSQFIGKYDQEFSRLVFVYPVIDVPTSRADFQPQLCGFDFDAKRDRQGLGTLLLTVQDMTVERQTEILELVRRELLPLGADALPRSGKTSSVCSMPDVASCKVRFAELAGEFEAFNSAHEYFISREEAKLLPPHRELIPGQVVYLIGSPGSGKTTSLAKLVRECRIAGQATLALKADLIDESFDLDVWLRRKLRMNISPIDAIRIIAARETVLLVIDQLDALANLVDLKSDRLNQLLSFVREATSIGNVSAVCSCREFEYRYDTRFSSLEAQSVKLELPEWEQVSKRIKAVGLDGCDNWPSAFRDILRTPQHLHVYLQRFTDTGNHAIFSSYQVMLDDLWQRKIRTRKQRDLAYRLASYCIENEVIAVPLVHLEDNQESLRRLESSELIKRTSGHVTFYHQTLLEHAKAKCFVKDGISLTKHVVARQDAILVRPTLWAVLKYMREADRTRYHNELDKLLASALRLHIRYLLIEFLGDVTVPDEREILLMSNWLESQEHRGRVLIAIRGNANWFAAFASSHFSTIMNLPLAECWPMVGVLSAGWEFARGKCLQLIKSHWIERPDRDDLTIRAIDNLDSWDQDAVNVVLQLIKRAKFGEEIPWWVSSLMSSISADKPNLAPDVFLEAITRQESLQSEHAGRYRSDNLLEGGKELYDLPAVAEAAPVAFLRTVWPWAVSILNRTACKPVSSVLKHYGGDLNGLEPIDRHHKEPVVDSIVIAVESTAQIDPSAFLDIIRPTLRSESLPVQRLIARGLACNPLKLADAGLEYLRSDDRRLYLGGFYSGPESDSITLIKSIAVCAESTSRITDLILNSSQYREESQLIDKQYSWDRESRLRLLKALPIEHLSSLAQNLVEELESEFPVWDRFPLSQLRGGLITEVPPISLDKMPEATDDEILQSLEGPEHGDRCFDQRMKIDGGWKEHGGTIAATRELTEFAKSEPGRVIGLLPQILSAGNEQAVASVMHGLAESELDSDQACNLVLHLADLGAETPEFVEASGYLLLKTCKHYAGLPSKVCEFLVNKLLKLERDDTSDKARAQHDESEEIGQGSVLWGASGGMVFYGRAYWPLVAMTHGFLSHRHPKTTEWIEALESLAESSIPADDWKPYCEELRWISLKGCDRIRAEAVISRLFELHPSVMLSSNAYEFIANAGIFLSEGFVKSFLSSMRASEQKYDWQAYGELLSLIALRGDPHKWTSDVLRQELSFFRDPGEPKRIQIARGVAYTAARVWEEAEMREAACQLLCAAIELEDQSIVEAFNTVFWASEDFPADNATAKLLDAIQNHPIVFEGPSVPDLVEHLGKLLPHFRQAVLSTCNCLLDRRGQELTSMAYELSSAGPTMVNISMTLQRFDDTRSGGLELLERLMQVGLNDAYAILQEIDIRPGPARLREPRRRRRRRA